MGLFDDIGVAWNEKDGLTWFEVPRSARAPKEVKVVIEDKRKHSPLEPGHLLDDMEPADEWWNEHLD